MMDHDHLEEALRAPDSDHEWEGPITEDQRREHAEIKMMVREIRDHGHTIHIDYRSYDRKYFVIMDGTKCYGQGPKVHAFLSGAYAAMDWRRSNDEED